MVGESGGQYTSSLNTHNLFYSFPVGRIICRESGQLEQQGATPPHFPSSTFQHSSDQVGAIYLIL